MLPRFIVIGAMKAGTTSLFHYLESHPEIYLHPRKELAFFVWPERERRVESYEDFFRSAEPGMACGDVSTQYTKFPMFEGVPQRIAELIPDVRLIYAVRDPVRRAVSHYRHEVLVGNHPGPVDRALREDARYVEFSRYRAQLALYEPHFDRDQIKVVVLEDLQVDPLAEVRSIFKHIGVDPCFVPANLGERANVSSERVMLTPMIKGIQSSRLYRAVQYSLPAGLKQAIVMRLGARPPSIDEPSEETLAWLAGQLSDDARDLARYLDRDLSDWPLLQGRR